MPRKICITAADGQTGHLVAELILTDEEFSSSIDKLTLIAMDTMKCSDLKAHGAAIVQHNPGKTKELVDALKNSGADTIFLIPPAVPEKLDVTRELVEATREVGVPNVVFLSAAGCDYAERDKQPRLREFIDLEAMVLENKGDTTTETGHSPCIIRAGFYAENLLLYNKEAQTTGKLPLPIGDFHKFAPVALGDIAHIAAAVLTSEGPHGLSDQFRGQMIVATGPMLVAGNELVEAAAQALKIKLQFTSISEKEAKKLLQEDTTVAPSEAEYLLDYYSLVREGKTNYVATIAYSAITGMDATHPEEFFSTYAQEFKPKRRRAKIDKPKGERPSKVAKTH